MDDMTDNQRLYKSHTPHMRKKKQYTHTHTHTYTHERTNAHVHNVQALFKKTNYL